MGWPLGDWESFETNRMAVRGNIVNGMANRCLRTDGVEQSA
jgi:hypothetical protein